MLRQEAADLLQREPDIEIAGQAADGQAAVELSKQLRPDIFVMDVRMPVLSGIEATRRIRNSMPEVQVLVGFLGVGIQERAWALDGQLTIRSSAKWGMRLCVVTPIVSPAS